VKKIEKENIRHTSLIDLPIYIQAHTVEINLYCICCYNLWF